MSPGSNGNHPADYEEEPERRLVVTRASAIPIRPVHWGWKDRIPVGCLSLLGGREGIGKSIIAYTLVASLTRGILPGRFHGEPRTVLVAATEDSWAHTIVPRLMAADADLDRVLRVEVRTIFGTRGDLTFPVDLDSLGDLIDSEKAAFLLLDPLLSRLSAKLDTHKDAEVRQALEPLVHLLDRAEIAALGLIHVNKGASVDPLTLLMASRAFAAVARAVLFATVDPDDPHRRYLGQAKNNLGRLDLETLVYDVAARHIADHEEGPVWTGELVWHGMDDRTVSEIMAASGADADTRSNVAEAALWLSDYLADHQPYPSQKIKQDGAKAGHDERTLKRALQRAHVRVTFNGFPRNSYWEIPTQSGRTAESIAPTTLHSGDTPWGDMKTVPTVPTGFIEDSGDSQDVF